MHLQLKLSVLVLFLCSFVTASAQTTAVTATITDSDSTVWTGASVFVSFQPNPAQPSLNSYTLGGVKLTSATYSSYLQQAVTTNSSGTLSVTLLDNSLITPSGSKWYFVIQSQTSAQAVTYVPISVSGASQSLTSYLSSGAIAPRFPAVNQAFGYADVEVHPIPQPGGQYYNVTLGTQRIWNGTAWTNGSSGGSPSGAASNGLTGNYPGPGINGTVAATALSGTTVSPKVINGTSHSELYTGATFDIRLNACLTDALNKTNGNTSGTCDASAEGGNPQVTGQVTIGDSNGDPVGLVLPCSGYWEGSGNNSTVPMFLQYGGTSVSNVCPASAAGGKLLIYPSSTAIFKYLWEIQPVANNSYTYTEGFNVTNISGGHATAGGIGFYLAPGSADTTHIHHVNVYDGLDTYGAEVYGACCETTWDNSSINGDNSTTPLYINSDIYNFNEGFTFSHGTIVHPGTGHPAVLMTDSAGYGLSSANFEDVYTETGVNNVATPIYQNQGFAHLNISNIKVAQFGSARNPIISTSNGYNTNLHVSDVWVQYGGAAWTYPITVIENAYTGQNISTDNNGYFASYSTPTASAIIPSLTTLGDIPYGTTGGQAARIPGNTTTNDEVLVSTGASSTVSPTTKTCVINGSGATSCTFSSNPAAGESVAVYVYNYNGGSPAVTITDSNGDTFYPTGGGWHNVTTIAQGQTQMFYYGPLTTSISSLTITGGSDMVLLADTTVGLASGPGALDTICTGDTASSTSSPCSSAMTTTATNDYVFCGSDNLSSVYPSAGSGFTNGANYGNVNFAAMYKVQSTAGAFTPAFTLNTAVSSTMSCLALFKATTPTNAPYLSNSPALSAINMFNFPAIFAPTLGSTATGTSPSTSPICPNGSGGTFTTSGCTSGSGAAIVTHTITGATPTVVVNSTSVPAVDVNNLVLSTNVTSITLPASTAVANSENIKLNIYQPASGGPYTLPTYTTATSPLTAGSGTTLVSLVQGGCPTIGTAANSQLQLELVYNTTLTQYQIVQCQLQPAVYSPGGTLTANGQAGIYSSGTVLNSDLMPLPGHFTNLEIVYGGGGCTTAPYLNVFASNPGGTPAYGTPGQGSTTTQTPGQGVDTTETLTFVAGQRIGIEVSTAALGCSASYYSITAHYVFSNNSN